MTAEEIIELLKLEPHPEGGAFRETFRDRGGADGRARSTAIYFLLREGQRSAWHTVDAIEMWHWYAGAPMSLWISEDGNAVEEIALGNDLAAGQRPQGIVPEGAWQSAQSRGEWTLVGCTVAPGFEFSGFRLAEPGWEPDDGSA